MIVQSEMDKNSNLNMPRKIEVEEANAIFLLNKEKYERIMQKVILIRFVFYV